MPRPFVIDSSALAKTFLDEPETPALRRWLRERLLAGDDFIGPTLLAYELGEVSRHKGPSDGRERLRVLHAALQLVRLVSHDAVLAGACSEERGLTFYDASFVALARATTATLVTYDRRILENARAGGYACISPGREHA